MISIAFDKRNHPADLIRQLSGVAEQLPFATSLAINRTAQKVRLSIVEEMRQSFDRPTPYTLRSLYIQPSTKENLEAVIQFKDKSAEGGKSTPASKYLSPAVFAENRRAKSHERKLRDAGILPSNMFLAPTRSAGGILNSFGNINRSVIKELLSDLGTRKTPFFVLGKVKPIGIARRESGTLKLLLWFTNTPNYKKKFDFYGVGERKVLEHLPDEIQKAVTFAMRTAK